MEKNRSAGTCAVSVIAVAAMLGLVGCTCKRIGEEPTQIYDGPTTGTITHSTGFEFPEKVGDFVRVNVRNYDTKGEDLSAGYNNDSLFIAATVYVYPRRGESLQAHFKETFEGIVSDRTGAVAGEPKEINLVQNGKSIKGHYGDFSVDENGVRSLSETHIFQFGTYFVKYRFTYPNDLQAAAKPAISAFMAGLKWPAK